MRKPIIGITTQQNSTQSAYIAHFAYSDAVTAAGATPILLPFRSAVSDIEQLLDICDGFVLAGPRDPGPRMVDPVRAEYELALLGALGRRRVPTLVIAAPASDGPPRAIEDPTVPLWPGLQWHPGHDFDDTTNGRLIHHLVEIVAATQSFAPEEPRFGKAGWRHSTMIPIRRRTPGILF